MGEFFSSVEWRTLFLMIGCAVSWFVVGFSWQTEFWWGGLLALPFLSAFHMSLQHEALHNHPTKLPWLNELLVGLPIAVVFPYRRYKDLHLKHHQDQNLTDPYEDPESYFWPENDCRKMKPLARQIFAINNTLAGRLLIGPVLTIIGFSRTELKGVVRNEPGVRFAWLVHGLSLCFIFYIVVSVFEMPVWLYGLVAVYPGLSLAALRAFAEHQAAENVGGRTAIVEAHPFWAILYLNNNLHIVHHANPNLPWYKLPSLYRERRAQYLAANGNTLFRGYAEIAKRFAFTTKQTVEHPFMYRSTGNRPGSVDPANGTENPIR